MPMASDTAQPRARAPAWVKRKSIVEMMRAGAVEGVEGVDGEQKEFGEGEEPEADAEGVTAAMREEQNQRPDEIELLFDGQGPEVIEGQG